MNPPSRDAITAALREIFLQRRSGALEMEHSTASERLVFRDGDLFLEETHPLAAEAATRLHSGKSNGGAVVERLVERMLAWPEVKVSFSVDSGEEPGDLLGPISTPLLTMELAVREEAEERLLERLGGEDQRLRADPDDPLLERLPELTLVDQTVLFGLAEPVSVGDLFSRLPGRRLEVAQRLCRLASVGLVQRVQDETTAAGAEEEPTNGGVRDSWATESGDEGALVPRGLLERFFSRIEESLRERPLAVSPDEHLGWLGELLRRVAGMTHYELLGVEVSSPPESVAGKYEEVARRVHPANVQRVCVKEALLGFLFERVTEAYLVLSDPKRRGEYNLAMGIPILERKSTTAIKDERREVARNKYRWARAMMDSDEYHFAVELMRDAVRLDPRPEYYALFGEAQSRNPNWVRHALESFETALRLSPREAGYRVRLAQLLEQVGRIEEAEDQYREALETVPGHPEAEKGLDRLAPRRPAAGDSVAAHLRKLLRKK